MQRIKIGEQELSPTELVELAAVDSDLYSRVFFPRTARQATPLFHREMWNLMESPGDRYIAFKVFRGGAKTTTTRLALSKRIAYAISRTIMVVGKNQDHARRSVEWLMKAVEFNKLWRETFGLTKGKKWTGTEIEIFHGIDEVPIRVLAVGMTGSVRGVNIDDYRPDFILMDDIIDEEMAATAEQRQKTEDLVFGALKESLAPESEAPTAKMALLGTPIAQGDIMDVVSRDPEWKCVTYGILDENGQSRWPERWSTEKVLQEKHAAIQRNQLSLWLREKQCEIISRETADFDGSWLQYWQVLPERMNIVLAVDPVPPPSEKQIKTGLRDKDFEALAVVGEWQGRCYVLETVKNKGHNPDWTIAEFFRLKAKWRPRLAAVEGVAYQRTLKWLLEQEMQKRREYIQIDCDADRRSKRDRIVQALHGVAANRMLYCHPSQVDFIEQFSAYPAVQHDDVIEAVAVATAKALDMNVIEGDFGIENEEEIPALPDNWRAAP